MTEEWRTIYIAPRYEVSNLGRVRTIKTLRIKQLTKTFDGYLFVGLRMEKNVGAKIINVDRPIRVSILVMHAFSPVIQVNQYIRYKDENRSNCRYENLYYAPRKEITKENWKKGKMKGSLKGLLTGHRFQPMEKHPNWNPKAPNHLRHIKYKKSQVKCY